MTAQTPPFSVIACDAGSFTLRDESNSQDMHSRIGPETEARLLYVDPSALQERVLSPAAGPLVIYDVGLGLAANSILALEVYQALPVPKRPLHLISFENRPDGLGAALDRIDAFPFLQTHQATLRTLLTEQVWRSADGLVTWQLLTGDFRTHLASTAAGPLPAPELIYYDFYAPSTCPELWTVEIFTGLYQLTQIVPNALLLTYSGATPVRRALLESGFYVGNHRSTPRKKQTTAATPDPSTLQAITAELLDDRFLAKFVEQPAIRQALAQHPQFKIKT